MKVIHCALAVLLAASSSAKPDSALRRGKADKVGGDINDSDGITITDSSSGDTPLSICSVCGDDTHREAVSVDYLIIGAGPGGMSTSADLSKAIKEIGSNQTVAVIEKSDYIGGRYFDVDLKTPEGYDGKLKNGHGALRTNPSTFPHLRRQMNEHGIQVYCSIFNNRLTARGRSASCDLQNECHIFGNFCSDKPIFVDKTNTEQMPFGAAFPLDEGILERTGGDPEGAAYLYILGYETINPATGNECDNSAESPSDQCPEEACKAATSWRSFLQSQLTHEYAELVEAMNYGFFGDFAAAFNACSYRDWGIREYDTLSINCYPEGGMSSLTDAHYDQSVNNNVKFYLEEPAICIDRSKDTGTLYEVRTPTKIFSVKEFLFMSAPHSEILQNLNGDLIDELKERPLTNVAKGSPVTVVLFQWDPETPSWWYDAIDKEGGSYSYRTYGDLDCFSRYELIDTPYHRQHNAQRVVYSDARCFDEWKELIEYSDEVGDYSKLTERALRGIRNAYPEFDIPEPIFVSAKVWDAGWYFMKPHSTATNEEVEAHAVNPISGENVCLVGDSWGLKYAAWSESAFVTSHNCLSQRFSGSALGIALDSIFAERESIVADYYENDPNFAAYPGEEAEGQAYPILDNENYAPFGCMYDQEDGSVVNGFKSGQNCGPPQCVEQGVPIEA